MKKTILILMTVGIAGVSMADFQAPPTEKNGPIRKLSRALSNIVYGVTEIPTQFAKTTREEGNSAAASYGLVHGTRKTVARLGFGIFELVTFPFPAYKGTYKAPYPESLRESTHPSTGYLEFPPEFGFVSGVQHNREQFN
ncbi:MAG: exosortase system-associated protein, TIGR04073 family [Verrucomicrobiaceae bacterium]|nr:MAG: exosortase system-associated protein, TIGR04073 family [Verrucomicrobiaceae bacterium]